MNDKKQNNMLILVQDAAELRMCQHLYLRGNFRQEMFFDKVDLINVWNRLWLSAKATGVIILSVVILNNHLHITAIFQSNEQRKRFKKHFRMSITQYHNIRYQVHGTLGTRDFKHGILKGCEDLEDCICYHIRNILHHGISTDIMNYTFSTARYIFDLQLDSQKGIYTRENLPANLAKAYLPIRVQLPKEWQMTREGLIVPPKEVFRRDMVETLFNGSREEYLEKLEQKTMREADDIDEPCTDTAPLRLCKDQEIVEYVKRNCRIPIPSMNPNQKMEAIHQIIEEYPNVKRRLLSRIFSIPNSTLVYRLKRWR